MKKRRRRKLESTQSDPNFPKPKKLKRIGNSMKLVAAEQNEIICQYCGHVCKEFYSVYEKYDLKTKAQVMKTIKHLKTYSDRKYSCSKFCARASYYGNTSIFECIDDQGNVI